MEALWLVLGIAILAATLLDVFLTSLNYDEAGFVAGPLATGQWRLLRRVTRRLPRRWRPLGLRQVTGLQIVSIITVWLFGVILGFGLIYYSQLSRHAFSASGSGELDFFNAMYFSAAQLSTVGGSTLTAEADVMRFLSIAETLSGVILVSLILTFLLGVYSVISDLHALCMNFFSAERGAGTPVASLAPYLRHDDASGLDGHLDNIASTFSSYTDGLRLHHAAYYFQSGHDRFALPYAIRMLGGTLGALRWGLPSGHPASTEPTLSALTFDFLEFGEYLHGKLRWTSIDVPEVVPADAFARMARTGARAVQDEWVARFVELDREMAGLVGAEPLADVDDAYRRYAAWLPFAFRAQQIALAVSEDLDYQPVIVSDQPVSLLHPQDELALRSLDDEAGATAVEAPAPGARGPRTGWQAFVDRHTLIDPGNARLRSALRTMLAAVVAAGSLFALFEALRIHDFIPALFGGFVAMLATGLSADKTLHGRKVTSLLFLLPVVLVVLLGALVSDSPQWTAVLVVAVAFAGSWVARFGPRWAALGGVSFMAYYFTLILKLEASDVLLYAAAATVGVLWAYVLNYVVLPERTQQVLRSGIDGFGRLLASSMDALIDAVSWARWDPDVRKRVSAELRQLQRSAASLSGQLTGEQSATGIEPARAAELRLRLFDVALASVELTAAARQVTGTAVSLELRAQLAGRIELLQEHLARLAARPVATVGATPDDPAPEWRRDRVPEEWPRPARGLARAVNELARAADVLHRAELAALDPAAQPPQDDDGDVRVEDLAGGAVAPAPAGDAPAPRLAPSTRRAVQAAVATAAGLGVGELVSQTHQYWATLSAYQVLGGTDGETFVKGAQRVGGTVAGAAVGFGIALWTGGNAAVIVPLLVLAVFASTYYRPVSAAVSTFWTTMMFALIYEFLGRLSSLALEQRVLETLAGAAVALLVAWWVLPTHTRTKLNRDVARLVTHVDSVVATELGRLTGEDTVSLRVVQQRLLVIDQDVRTISTTAAPLRHSAGTLELGGVEGRLTAVWSLTSDTRNLVRAVERALKTGVDLTSQDWADWRSATSQNAAALVAVLNDRLPGPVRADVGSDQDLDVVTPAERAEDAVVRRLARINQTLVFLVDDLSPGAVTDDAPQESARA